MKQGIHPENYRFVVFKDMSNGYSFLSRSTAASKETILWEDGNEYPVIKLEISNTSHPFYTGKNMLVDTAGRIDKFKKTLREEEIISTSIILKSRLYRKRDFFLPKFSACHQPHQYAI